MIFREGQDLKNGRENGLEKKWNFSKGNPLISNSFLNKNLGLFLITPLIFICLFCNISKFMGELFFLVGENLWKKTALIFTIKVSGIQQAKKTTHRR